ncbi:hypothetical protein EKI60_04800 [Candidatus Saccharibacteria bacterium]|nr:MAG: hypothetical protein EKI60_04800 [Candidatus Saccharibacteria bacterium]
MIRELKEAIVSFIDALLTVLFDNYKETITDSMAARQIGVTEDEVSDLVLCGLLTASTEGEIYQKSVNKYIETMLDYN